MDEYKKEFHLQFPTQDLNILVMSPDGELVTVEDGDTGTVDVYKRFEGVYVWYGYAKSTNSTEIMNF